jgi:hypothetical protein
MFFEASQKRIDNHLCVHDGMPLKTPMLSVFFRQFSLG